MDAPRLRYVAGGYGKFEFRVRERHVAEHLIPLMRSGAVGAAKLDLAMRAVALLPEHARKHEPGTILYAYSYERLHDLARSADIYGAFGSESDVPAEVVASKRKWVGEQLARLEDLKLVRRLQRKGRRPHLLVLRDDGSGEPFDDPDGSAGNSYVRLNGPLIARRIFARWGAPELSAYLAAMTAERYTDAARGISRTQPGTGRWFRPLGWFADSDGKYGPDNRIRLPFAVRTLERGMVALELQGLLRRDKTTTDPFSNRRLTGPRVVYLNRFLGPNDIAVADDDRNDRLETGDLPS